MFNQTLTEKVLLFTSKLSRLLSFSKFIKSFWDRLHFSNLSKISSDGSYFGNSSSFGISEFKRFYDSTTFEAQSIPVSV